MSVRFGHEITDADTTPTLWGKPWPSDELKALFNMVPDKCLTIDWVRGLGYFTVRRSNAPGYYETVLATDGFSYERWAQVLALGLQFKHVSPP